jgi:hypothetical protein
MAITTPLDRPITAWLPVHIEGKLAEFFEAIRLKLVELDGGGGALVENSVLLGTAGGGIGGSADLLYSVDRFVSTGVDLGLKQLGATNGDVSLMVEDLGIRIHSEGADLVFAHFQGSATTRSIQFEGRNTEYKAGSPSFHIGNANTGNPTLAIGDNIIRSHQHLNMTLFSASYASGVANGLGCLGIQPATTIPTTTGTTPSSLCSITPRSSSS